VSGPQTTKMLLLWRYVAKMTQQRKGHPDVLDSKGTRMHSGSETQVWEGWALEICSELQLGQSELAIATEQTLRLIKRVTSAERAEFGSCGHSLACRVTRMHRSLLLVVPDLCRTITPLWSLLSSLAILPTGKTISRALT
jgi:hypothetical protein